MSHVVDFPGLGLQFTVNEVAFSIGGYDIRWYGVIIALGYLLAILYAFRSVKKMNIDLDRLIDAVIAGTLGGIVCARLYYVLFYPGDKYWKDPIQILYIHDGGIAIYGGMIGALVFGGLVAHWRKLRVPAVLDLASLGFLIGQGVGRWGNFVNQECFGEATTLPWGMASDNTRILFPDSPVHPCFLYESLLCLLGFVVLHIFTRRFRRYDGQTFILYLIWYGAARFFIEGTRTDSLMVGPLRVSQVVAAGCVAVGLALLVVFRRRNDLTGCGSRYVMESIGLTESTAAADAPKSTIFGDLPPFEEETEGEDPGEPPQPQGESEEQAADETGQEQTGKE
ncbi:prolipoprotein diacylglyceryl transferase [Acutalibacter caecimuris]|uniref:prolipoprotein diacylglyceryl transferase n=1 Tax=Acutalibacter caecimuris TaxID=3093657 RepID=UPI002AC963C0|nr:prolipoprotein diacylglyceryl transferase [Acutalibacter sp. M00118]